MFEAPWDIRVTLDLFLGGLGIGVFLVSVLLSFYDKDRYAGLIKTTAILAPVLVGLGILMLLSELGRPERFILTMFNFNGTSMVSWGGMLQGAFMVISLIYAGLLFKGSDSGSLRGLQVAGVVFAVCVGVYHGLLLSSLGRPLWAGGMVTALFLVSSLLGGVGVTMLVKSFSASAGVPSGTASQVAASGSAGFNFSFALFSLALLNLALAVAWQVSIFRAGSETIQSAELMMADFGFMWSALVIGVGLVIPVIASCLALLNRSAEMNKGMATLMGVLVVVGGFAMKHIILTAGQVKLPF